MLSFPAGMRLSIHVESVKTLPSDQRQLIAKVLDEKKYQLLRILHDGLCNVEDTLGNRPPGVGRAMKSTNGTERLSVVGVVRNKKGSSATFISSCMY
jgi:hypothetical protein